MIGLKSFIFRFMYFLPVLAAFFCMGAASPVEPLPLNDTPIPDALKGWTQWAIQGHESERCPVLASGSSNCIWNSSLTLELGSRGGKFSMRTEAFAPVDLALPWARPVWPTDIRLDKVQVPVASRGSDSPPYLHLEAGSHVIEGNFEWQEIPSNIVFPASAALVSLSWNGKKIAAPRFEKQGTLILSFLNGDSEGAAENPESTENQDGDAQAGQEKSEDALEMTVRRKLEDGIPMKLITKIDLKFSGTRREDVIGPVLPKGFTPISMDGPIPARIDEKGMLRIMARPGNYSFEIEARLEGSGDAFQMPSGEGDRWVSEEIWAFAPAPNLRQVGVSGAETVDPRQAEMPSGWRGLSAYRMEPSTVLTISETHRGKRSAEEGADELTMSREMWLDFDGKGFSVVDSINGQLSRSRRLTAQTPLALGRISAGGEPMLITKSDEGIGVELKQGSVNMTAEGRILRESGSQTPLAWNQMFKKASVHLNLPPGWRLIGVGGAGVSGSGTGAWLDNWDLLSVFLLLLCAVAAGKLFGIGIGTLAFAAMLLIIPEENSLVWFILALLAVEGVFRLCEKTRARGFFSVMRWIARIALALMALVFCTDQLGKGVHPILEHRSWNMGSENSYSRHYSSRSEEQSLRSAFSKSANALAERKMADELMEMEEEPRAAALPMMQDADGAGMMGGAAAEKKVLAKSGKAAKRKSSRPSGSMIRKTAKTFADAATQTGEGTPTWRWKEHSLSFDGPADETASISLWLVPPALHRLASVLRVLLLLALLLTLFGIRHRSAGSAVSAEKKTSAAQGTSAAAALILAALLPAAAVFSPAEASAAPSVSDHNAAVMPSAQMLDDLRGRLLKRPACSPRCGSLAQLKLSISAADSRMRAEATIHAAAPTAIPLPGIEGTRFPSTVRTDGADAVLLRDYNGALWVYVSKGIHNVVMDGSVPQRGSFTVSMPEPPKKTLISSAEGFTISGLQPNGQIQGGGLIVAPASAVSPRGAAPADLSGTNDEGEGEPGEGEKDDDELDEALEEDDAWKNNFQPLFEAVRTFRFGLTWEVETTVNRLSPEDSSVIIDVPLLPGEQVLTDGVQVVDRNVRVSMPPGEDEFTWKSSLETAERISLTAVQGKPIFERWEFDVGRRWHVEYGNGVPLVSDADGRLPGELSAEMALFRPLPGETLEVTVTQPQAAEGKQMTLQRSSLDVKPGSHQMEATLELDIIASVGSSHPIRLPVGAKLSRVKINGSDSQVRLSDEGIITVPVSPGKTRISVVWTQPMESGLSFTAPVVDAGIEGINASSKISMGSDRWILFVGGAPAGPVVRFWALLLGMLLFAFLLSRFGQSKPGFGAWALLLGGLAVIEESIPAMISTSGWLLFMAWRGRSANLSRWKFNLRQVISVAWTVVFICMLFAVVGRGLMGAPDMRIEGMGSYNSTLYWFTDRTSSGILPAPWVISIPMYVYKGAMLLWALWLAFSLVNWLRWGFHAFGEGGMWKSKNVEKIQTTQLVGSSSPDSKVKSEGKGKENASAPASAADDAKKADKK